MDIPFFRCFEKKEHVWLSHTIPLASVEYLKVLDPERFAFSLATGMQDKNGVPLYEHDYVRFRDSLYMIYYEEPEFVLECLLGEGKGELFLYECEYVGNYYDNPELYEKIIEEETQKFN